MALHERAMDDLRFIRQTMERANAFTAVPGWGNVVVGMVALVAAALASHQESRGWWLTVWILAAFLGVLIGGTAITLKARRSNVALRSGPGRTFVLSFLPPILAAIALTITLYLNGIVSFLPGLWMLCYGAAILAAGTFSVRVVPVMGTAFMVLGAMTLASPAGWGDAWMAASFGGLHIGFGIVIARRYGG